MRTSDNRTSDASADQATVEALISSVVPPRDATLAVEGELARGGMATIHVAVDLGLKRRVALKQIHASNQDSALAVRSFIREAQITGQLDHPNIVPVHELGVDSEQRLYFTMKLVEGRTLQDLIHALRATHVRIDAHGNELATLVDHDDLLRMLDAYNKILDALAFAHSRGVVHLDLKPENVMVGDFGQVYLMDWGIAKVMPAPSGGDPLTRKRQVSDTLPLSAQRENIIMGTPAYMSPEQARGDHRSIDTRTDIFALGAILYEIVTGLPPYRGRSAVDVLMQAEEANASLPKDLPISRELRRIIGKAMASDPAGRYLNVESLQADIQRFLRGGGNFPRQTYPPGAWIVREDEVGDAAYIIMSGTCEVYKQIDGQLESLRMLGRGDVFGETAILASTTRTASVVAKTKVVAVIVTRDVLEQEVDAMKPWMGAFIRALAQRFSEGEEKRMAAASMHSGVRPATAVEIANQALMVLKTWGRWDRDLGLTMPLGQLCQLVGGALRTPEQDVSAALASYAHFRIEPRHDSVALRDDRALKTVLERELGW